MTEPRLKPVPLADLKVGHYVRLYYNTRQRTPNVSGYIQSINSEEIILLKRKPKSFRAGQPQFDYFSVAHLKQNLKQEADLFDNGHIHQWVLNGIYEG